MSKWIIVWTKRNGVDRYAKLVLEPGEKSYLLPRISRANATVFDTYQEAEDVMLSDAGRHFTWQARELK